MKKKTAGRKPKVEKIKEVVEIETVDSLPESPNLSSIYKVKVLRCSTQFPLNNSRTSTFYADDPRLPKGTVALFNEDTGFITIKLSGCNTVVISPSSWCFIELFDAE